MVLILPYFIEFMYDVVVKHAINSVSKSTFDSP